MLPFFLNYLIRSVDSGAYFFKFLTTSFFALSLLAPVANAADLPSAVTNRPSLDVPYVPTRPEVVNRMLEMADLKPEDYLIDLGSGDGRIVIAAVRDWNVRRALGIDLDPERVREAKENAREADIEDRVTFEQGDLFKKDISEATVLTMYLLQTVNARLRPVILDTMAPGTRIVSHAFDMGDWEPEQSDRVNGSAVYLWIVPARVEGRWQLQTNNGEKISLSLNQRYQKVTGEADINGKTTSLSNASLRGEKIKFSIGDKHYVGTVNGNRMNSRQEGDSVKDWHAQRL